MPSHYFQWLPVDNWGWGRGKAHDPETGSRQGGDLPLESGRMFCEEENAAVGARAAS